MALTIKNDTGLVVPYTKILNDDGTELGETLAVERVTLDLDVKDGIVRACVYVGLVKTDIRAAKADFLTKNPVSGQYEKVNSVSFANGDLLLFSDDGEVTVVPKDNGSSSIMPIHDGRRVNFRTASDDTPTEASGE